MRTLPPMAGPDNDLQDLIQHYVERADNNTAVKVSAVAALEDHKPDHIFRRSHRAPACMRSI